MHIYNVLLLNMKASSVSLFFCIFDPLSLCLFVSFFLVSMFLCSFVSYFLFLCIFVPLFFCSFVTLCLCSFDLLFLCAFVPLFLWSFISLSLCLVHQELGSRKIDLKNCKTLCTQNSQTDYFKVYFFLPGFNYFILS